MLRQSEHLSLSELVAFEEDAALSDASPGWLVPGLGSLREVDDDDDDDGPCFRSLIEEPEALSRAWRVTGGGPPAKRARGRRKRSGRSLRWSLSAE